jgi:hypothetical protein
MALDMPQPPTASSPTGRRRLAVSHWLLLLILLAVPEIVQARAGPEPKAKPQNEIENYNEYTDYGEDVYGKFLQILHDYHLPIIFMI